jgi:hypothetical protein
MDNSDDQPPFVIERSGPKGRVRLGPDAKAWAAEWGMTEEEMARHLLSQDQQGDGYGQQQPSIAEQMSGAPSQNIEDRRGQPPYVDPVLTGINPYGQQQPPIRLPAAGPSALSYQAGCGAIGASPPSQQQPQFYGATQPSNFLPQDRPPTTEELGFAFWRQGSTYCRFRILNHVHQILRQARAALWSSAGSQRQLACKIPKSCAADRNSSRKYKQAGVGLRA